MPTCVTGSSPLFSPLFSLKYTRSPRWGGSTARPYQRCLSSEAGITTRPLVARSYTMLVNSEQFISEYFVSRYCSPIRMILSAIVSACAFVEAVTEDMPHTEDPPHTHMTLSTTASKCFTVFPSNLVFSLRPV